MSPYPHFSNLIHRASYICGNATGINKNLVCLRGNANLPRRPAIFSKPTNRSNFASMIYLDGKNVIENAQFPVNKDQFLSLETYDLQPNSTVELSTQQNGFPLVKKVYQTNERGAMKDILFFPKAKSNIKCVLRFMTQNGQEKRVVFHIKPV